MGNWHAAMLGILATVAVIAFAQWMDRARSAAMGKEHVAMIAILAMVALIAFAQLMGWIRL